MGLFGFLRRGDRSAIPDPGTPEFEAMVRGTALPDSQSVEMGQGGWASAGTHGDGAAGAEAGDAAAAAAGSTQRIDLRGTGAREKVLAALRDAGIDPDAKQGQQIDATSVPGLMEVIGDVMRSSGVEMPEGGMTISTAEGTAAWVGNAAASDPVAQIEYLAGELEAGRITQAEFEAQKRHLLGG